MPKRQDMLGKRAGEPRGSLAYAKLRDGIRAGIFKPGQRIREVDLSGWLKMSRTPIREALRRLESEGLLTHEPHRGVVISSLDHQMVMELYFMREVLEGTAARLASRHASDAEIFMLRQMVIDESNMPADPMALSNHNYRFHLAILRSAHNRYLLRSLNALREAMWGLVRTTFSVPGRPATAVKEHQDIVAAIASRDGDAAEAAARKHIQIALVNRLLLLNEEDANGADI
ncbi:MAG: GntR family transcriptional regulator [Alphaproteobacteria bacterium]|nr:GntR family transcriptional regulator [Alphaproteobacteria bacterium]